MRTAKDDDEDPLEASNPALQLGAGYDVRTGSKIWLTPFANLIVSTSGNLTSGSTIVTDASAPLVGRFVLDEVNGRTGAFAFTVPALSGGKVVVRTVDSTISATRI